MDLISKNYTVVIFNDTSQCLESTNRFIININKFVTTYTPDEYYLDILDLETLFYLKKQKLIQRKRQYNNDNQPYRSITDEYSLLINKYFSKRETVFFIFSDSHVSFWNSNNIEKDKFVQFTLESKSLDSLVFYTPKNRRLSRYNFSICTYLSFLYLKAIKFNREITFEEKLNEFSLSLAKFIEISGITKKQFYNLIKFSVDYLANYLDVDLKTTIMDENFKDVVSLTMASFESEIYKEINYTFNISKHAVNEIMNCLKDDSFDYCYNLFQQFHWFSSKIEFEIDKEFLFFCAILYMMDNGTFPIVIKDDV